MAKEMVLVSLEEWKRLKAQRQEQNHQQIQATADEKDTQPMRNTIIVAEDERRQNTNEDSINVDKIVELLPKTYRSRARILLHYLSPKLDASLSHFIYPSGDKSSHVLDLIRFALNPLSKRAPSDFDDFVHLMKISGVPESFCSNRITNSDSALPMKKHWLTLDMK